MHHSKHTHYRRDQFHQWTDIDVRWGELDAYAHVNNVVFFSYFEAARVQYITDIAMTDFLMGNQCLQMIVHCSMNFRKEVGFPARIQVGTRITEIGTSSYTMHSGMFLDDSDTLVADGSGTIVCINPATKRPMPIPDEFLEAIQHREQRTFSRPQR